MIYAIATVLVLILDQAVKFLTTKNILLDAIGSECVTLIPGVIHLTNVHNYGAAFSILENARWLLVVVSLVFVIAIIFLISTEILHTPFSKWSAVLVMAGALGNCIDRLLYGYVVDMFELEFMNFAVFNVADMFITVCGILFCLHIIIYREPEAVRAANESPAARRRREEREAKEKPFENIPHRGEHKSLADELRPANPDEPFAEWEFGAEVDDSDKSSQKEPERPHRRAKTKEEPLEEPRSHVHSVQPEEPSGHVQSMQPEETQEIDIPQHSEQLPAEKDEKSVPPPDRNNSPTMLLDFDDTDDFLSLDYLDEDETGYSVEDILAEFGSHDQ